MSLYAPEVHHDSSELFVSNTEPQLGQAVKVSLQVRRPGLVDGVILRTVHDGEPQFISAQRIGEFAYEAELPIVNIKTHYRWGLQGGAIGYAWLNALGLHDHDVSDVHDFAITAFPMPPEWLRSAVVYQVFPDRFSRSGRNEHIPKWAVPRSWDQLPEGRSVNTGREYFGGDLWGIAERLDYIQELGATVVYMTPFFPGKSNHRYDAVTFDCVDPALGGDEALRHLIDEAHRRGMRVIGDITLNHCGSAHEWFVKAQQGDGLYREFFTFDEALPHGYECWCGHASLPKFNYASEALQEAMITGPSSVLRRWLRFGLDGWRVDVANMSGRQGALDMTHEVARMACAVVMQEGPNKALIAEHNHDAGFDLRGDGWQGTMSYATVARPVWAFVTDGAFDGVWFGNNTSLRSYTGAQAVAAIRSFAATMPWRSWQHSWGLLGSHDTARIRSVAGSAQRQAVAAALLMTLPGTPMLFAGDEIGATGLSGEASRTTFPWDQQSQWDVAILKQYRDLITLRKNRPALIDGGIEWVHSDHTSFSFIRRSRGDAVYVAVSNGKCQTESLQVNARLLGDMHIADGRLFSKGPSYGVWEL